VPRLRSPNVGTSDHSASATGLTSSHRAYGPCGIMSQMDRSKIDAFADKCFLVCYLCR